MRISGEIAQKCIEPSRPQWRRNRGPATSDWRLRYLGRTMRTTDGVLAQSRVSAETLVYPLGGRSGVSAETRNHIPKIPRRDTSP
jgi:hypothetical protein